MAMRKSAVLAIRGSHWWLRPFFLRTANLTKELPKTHGLEIEASFGATPAGACGGGFNATLPL